ncbi:TadE/TadG family type IV pilus assembly protein [uncultured Parasphingopyxis sp.]|uniref:TadE/TadG family type IV pilus assembly protein n=1 Tax=uncultured Parasphingopyxis sp. TaxID=1547918 RepID=UPI002613368D|nr:TadE/TadG family type IV pilus assembly protein [uncultured Parasphingopyxis sp.]
MTAILARLGRDRRGSVGVETTLTLPVLIVLIFGIIQVSNLLWAQASLSNAVGQAARYATIYPSPSDSQIEAYARSSQLGIDAERVHDVSVDRGTASGRNYVEISMSYSAPTTLIFFEGPDVTLTHQRRAYTH